MQKMGLRHAPEGQSDKPSQEDEGITEVSEMKEIDAKIAKGILQIHKKLLDLCSDLDIANTELVLGNYKFNFAPADPRSFLHITKVSNNKMLLFEGDGKLDSIMKVGGTEAYIQANGPKFESKNADLLRRKLLSFSNLLQVEKNKREEKKERKAENFSTDLESL